MLFSVPMAWQQSVEESPNSPAYIPLSSCVSIVALSLTGNRRRRYKKDKTGQKAGPIYDPFCPWIVLTIEASPDGHASVGPENHIMNGPIAFLVLLEMEFRKFRKRISHVCDKIFQVANMPVSRASIFEWL